MKLVLLSFVILFNTSCFSTEKLTIVIDSKIEKKVDELLKEPVERRQFSGTVLVFEKDDVLFAKGYGLANPEHGIKNDVNTVFRIGSMTKQFTAMGIMILKEEGKLQIDDYVIKYLPKFKIAKNVKIRNLLSHSSGIQSYTNLKFYKEIMRLHNEEIDIIKRLYSLPLEFQPGKKVSYSNSNYLMLTHIIEKASGKKYEDFMETKIFKKLGLENTGLDNHRKIIPNRASGLTSLGDRFILSDFVDMSVPSGAGAMYSSVLDLVKWYQAIRDYKLISESSTEEMLTPFKNEFAFGWFVTGNGDDKMVSHGGAIEGFRSHIAFYPETDSLTVTLSNMEGSLTSAVSGELGKILFGKEYKPFEFYDEIPLDLEKAKSLVGTYELKPGFNLIVSLENGKLYGQATGQGKFQLFRAKENFFFLKVMKAQVSFIHKDGKVIELILHQGGHDIKGVKS